MEFVVLGDADAGPPLALDRHAFSYAGKFRMSNTGKAAAREPTGAGDENGRGGGDAIVAAVAFNDDRAHEAGAWLRYVTVRADRRGEGIGARLCAFTAEYLLAERAYERVRIAVNNPFAFHALHKAGFGWTGERTGIAELVLERPAPADAAARYREGLAAYADADRELSDAEAAFVAAKRDAGPPERVPGEPDAAASDP